MCASFVIYLLVPKESSARKSPAKPTSPPAIATRSSPRINREPPTGDLAAKKRVTPCGELRSESRPGKDKGVAAPFVAPAKKTPVKRKAPEVDDDPKVLVTLVLMQVL